MNFHQLPNKFISDIWNVKRVTVEHLFKVPETTGSQKRRLNAMRPLFRDDSTNGETRITIFFKIMRDRIDV
jgi:hypothetical protein